MQTLNRYIDLFEKYSITILFAVATLMLFSNVVLRYFFDTGLIWVLELVQYLFAWVVLIGAAHGVKVGVHLGIDILLDRMATKFRKATLMLAILCCIIFVAIVDYNSFIYTFKIYQWGDITEDLQIPQWIPYLSIPIGLSLMLYHFLSLAWEIVTEQRTNIHTSEAHAAMENIEDI
ncbi:MAG: TRAP transporter small permease [Gammaproteobacteria bacterium]|nr:TRAP transporter small permease [Gammaproteobacteria bacterium]MCW8986127.1 TRAP transporter small permease [Gammaproteobacteria bacterium]